MIYPLITCTFCAETVDPARHRHVCAVQILVLPDGSAAEIILDTEVEPELAVRCDGLSGYGTVYRRGAWTIAANPDSPYCQLHAQRIADRLNAIRDGALAVQRAIDRQPWAERVKAAMAERGLIQPEPVRKIDLPGVRVEPVRKREPVR